MEEPLALDGSAGGGQLLRSALSLSLTTGRAFRMSKLRAQRSTPGLRTQDLACLRGALAISDSQVEGAEVGSAELTFRPGPVRSGEYLLDVGTAGSTPLVLQCLVYPLALSGGGQITLRGGSHVPRSPSYHYLAWVWQPAMRTLGLEVSLGLRSAGFFPEGAGELRAQIAPWREASTGLSLHARGTLVSAVVTSLFGGVPLEVAERQARAAAQALREHGILCEEEHLPMPTHRSGGSAVFIRLQFERSVAGFSELGERQVSAESVGQGAAQQAARFMESAGAVDAHLADQLVLPAALAASGRLGTPRPSLYRSEEVTPHLRTHVELAEKFLSARGQVFEEGVVVIAPFGTT